MAGRGQVRCWNCSGVTSSLVDTCIHCGHPLAAAPSVAVPVYGGELPPQLGPSAYPFPMAPGSPSMRAQPQYSQRFFAALIDFFIVAVLYLPFLVIFPIILGTNLYQWAGWIGGVLNILVPMSLFWFFKSAFEMTWATTPGKRVMGLKVVGRDLNPVSTKQALLRNADMLIWGFSVGIVPLVSFALIKSRGQSLGDMFADTFVVPR